MSRLDHHVTFVQSKLTFGRFLNAAAYSGMVLGGAVLAAIVADRVLSWHLPKPMIWFYSSLGAATVGAFAYAVAHRPTLHEAAIAIDRKLGLQEKFSTALLIRPNTDPFAQAAVIDAEKTAENVSLNRQFPVKFPRAWYGTLSIALVAGMTAWLLQPMDLFGKDEEIAKTKQVEVQKTEAAKRVLKDALAQVESAPVTAANKEEIKAAKLELTNLLNAPMKDPAQANRTALKALQDVQAAIKQQVKENQKYAEAQSDIKMAQNLAPDPNDKGPVADAQKKISEGKYNEAANDISKLVDNFDKMDQGEKEKAAKDLQKLADKLANAANDPAKQKDMENQLKKMGATQQQAQQMAQQMQQAANGDKQAQQQLQQQAQQLMQQMNNGQGPSQQQQQQAQNMLKQMQAQAGSQAQANQMAQAAQQMAQAMQQAAQQGQQGQQQQGQQGQGQQAQGGQQQGQQAQGGQKGQQQGQQGQQGQQPGQQPGGQQGQSAQQQMAGGAQSMKEQLQQMQEAARDAEQMDQQAQANQNAQQDAQNALNPGNQGQGGQGNNPGQGQQGQQANGQPGGQPGNGGPGEGRGFGDRNFRTPAPFSFKEEKSKTEDNEAGRILGKTLVKASSIKGESKQQLQDVAAAAEKQVTDEIDEDRMSRRARNVIREYFGSMQKEAEATPATPGPSTQPSK